MKKINDLSLREKVGQMMIIRIHSKELGPEEIEMIKDYKIGGIILYRKNYDSYEEMLNIINGITKLNKENGNVPLFISIDQEGGRVNRMPKEIKKFKSAKELSDIEDINVIKESGSITAEMLRKTGINMNFAPVLDIQRFEDKHAIGDRCFGDNMEDVSNYGIEFMKQMQRADMIKPVSRGVWVWTKPIFEPVGDPEQASEEIDICFKNYCGKTLLFSIKILPEIYKCVSTRMSITPATDF